MKISDLINEEEIKDYNQDEFMKDLNILLKLIMATGIVKGKGYKNSWCKRGELVSIWGNATRKTDRIENILKDIQKSETAFTQDSFFDTIMDTSVYYCLWSTLRIIKRNLNFLTWLDRNENIDIKENFITLLNEEQLKRWHINNVEDI